MKKILLSMGALSALAIAAPAAAQYSPAYGYRYGPDQEIGRLQSRLDVDYRRGLISSSDASRLRQRLDDLQRMNARYRYNGMSGWERGDIDRRLAAVRDQLASIEGYRGGDRAYGYGDRGYAPNYQPGYDRYGQGATGGDYDNDGVANRYDRDDDNDGVADRYDRDDNDDGYDDRYEGGPAGPYAARPGGGPAPQTGPAPYGSGPGGPAYDNGPVGAAPYDNGPAGAALNVGDRAPADLGAVPPQFQNLYPDGSLVYYRFRDGAVYQIDRATNTIRWVGQIPY